MWSSIPNIDYYDDSKILVTDGNNNYSIITIKELSKELNNTYCQWKYWMEIPEIEK